MDGLSIDQFRAEIVRPTIKHLGLWSESAENLLVGTALVESGLAFIRQLGGGPGRGVFQIEPRTHRDCYVNYLNFRPPLKEKVEALAGREVSGLDPDYALIGNLHYGCAIARVIYRRASDPLPNAGDPEALATYWKRHYNTVKGAGTVERAMPYFTRALV